MVIKVYFDVSWTGPEIQTDANGKVTSTGEVKGKPRPSTHPRVITEIASFSPS
jgi:hypothetical protein